MESKVSPANIQERAEVLSKAEADAAAAKPPEVKPADAAAPEAKPAEVKPADAAAKPAEVKPAEVKPAEVKPAVEAKAEEKPSEKKKPNDPDELRKWNVKVSQENAELRADIKSMKAAIEKLSKKPIDYKELAKNPELIQKQIETERQEAIAEMQVQLKEKEMLASTNETIAERVRREHDTENYPRWGKLFPLIQTLTANLDGRINFAQKPGAVLDDLYKLAGELSPESQIVPASPAPAVEATPATPAVPAAKTFSQAEVDALLQKAKAELEATLRGDNGGAGIGGQGNGGKRNSGVSTEALKTMPLNELKSLIERKSS